MDLSLLGSNQSNHSLLPISKFGSRSRTGCRFPLIIRLNCCKKVQVHKCCLPQFAHVKISNTQDHGRRLNPSANPTPSTPTERAWERTKTSVRDEWNSTSVFNALVRTFAADTKIVVAGEKPFFFREVNVKLISGLSCRETHANRLSLTTSASEGMLSPWRLSTKQRLGESLRRTASQHRALSYACGHTASEDFWD